jgi:hypothetical protein
MIHYLLYVDPGSGSYLIQVLTAAVLGIAYFFKNIRIYVRVFFARLFSKQKEK